MDYNFVPNPFAHKIHLTWKEKAQIAIMTFTILPLRIVGILVSLFWIIVLTKLATIGLPNDAQEPLTGWRKNIQKILMVFLKLGFFSSSIHSLEINGRENINKTLEQMKIKKLFEEKNSSKNFEENLILPTKGDPLITVIAPHSTFFDTISILAFENFPSGFSRRENVQVPILGSIAKYFRPISINRLDGDSRKTSIIQFKQRIQQRVSFIRNCQLSDKKEKIKKDNGSGDSQNKKENLSVKNHSNSITDSDSKGFDWPSMVSFPEGTTGNGKFLLSFKQGAFIPGLPVQPLCIRHSNPMDTLSWTWIGPPIWKIIWYTLCQFSTKTTLTYLPLYVPNQSEKEDPILFAKNVQKYISDFLGLKCTDYTIEDSGLFNYICRLKMEATSELLFLDRFFRKTNFRTKCDLLKIIEEKIIFSENHDELNEKLNKKNNYSMKYEDFSNFMSYLFQDGNLLSFSPSHYEEFFLDNSFQQLFHVFSNNHDEMDIRKFFVFFCLAFQFEDTKIILDMAFSIFSEENRRALNKSEFSYLMKILMVPCLQIKNINQFFFANTEFLTFGMVKSVCTEEKLINKFRCLQNLSVFFSPKSELMSN